MDSQEMSGHISTPLKIKELKNQISKNKKKPISTLKEAPYYISVVLGFHLCAAQTGYLLMVDAGAIIRRDMDASNPVYIVNNQNDISDMDFDYHTGEY